jgi:hypothetical protein
MRKSWLLRLIHFWPPYLGAGVRVTKIAPDFTSIEVEMKLRFWNTNYVGTHFGGSLYSMVDPFYMLMLLENLGRDYLVWDKAATIRFKRPGRGRVRARFQVSREEVEAIRALADREDKTEPRFQIQILDEEGSLVAEVEKVLWVRRKDRA